MPFSFSRRSFLIRWCRRKESSRSLSHLSMSVLLIRLCQLVWSFQSLCLMFCIIVFVLYFCIFVRNLHFYISTVQLLFARGISQPPVLLLKPRNFSSDDNSRRGRRHERPGANLRSGELRFGAACDTDGIGTFLSGLFPSDIFHGYH